MSDKKRHADDCGCEHHDHTEDATHHIGVACPTETFADNLIEYLKKEFEKESGDKK
ncbi:MAG: hypothetical protein ACFFHV_15805 [Promethearchaeota archaeon]